MFGSSSRARRVLVASCAAVLVAVSMSACSTEPADEFTRSYFEDIAQGRWDEVCAKSDDAVRTQFEGGRTTCEDGARRMYEGRQERVRDVTVDATHVEEGSDTATFRKCDIRFAGEPIYAPFNEVTVTDRGGGWKVGVPNRSAVNALGDCPGDALPSSDVVLVGHPVTG